MQYDFKYQSGTRSFEPDFGRVINATDGGYSVGVEDGRQAEYDRFWDEFQDGGNQRNYTCALGGSGWNDETYNPKHPIIATAGSSYMFWNTEITDTKIDIDIGDTSGDGVSRFNAAKKLITIRKLIVGEGAAYTNCFAACYALENITFEGVIGNSISFAQSSKLTAASVQSIIDHLKDLTGKTAQTLTFHATVGAKLTEEQKETIAAKNWTLAY